jgi:hypothetical protein
VRAVEVLEQIGSPEAQRRVVKHLDDLQDKVDALKGLQAQAGTELDALLPAVLDKAFKGNLTSAIQPDAARRVLNLGSPVQLAAGAPSNLLIENPCKPCGINPGARTVRRGERLRFQ